MKEQQQKNETENENLIHKTACVDLPLSLSGYK